MESQVSVPVVFPGDPDSVAIRSQRMWCLYVMLQRQREPQDIRFQPHARSRAADRRTVG